MPESHQRAFGESIRALGGPAGSRGWPALITSLGALEPSALHSAVALALPLCRENRSTPSRARLTQMLAQTPEPERAALVAAYQRIIPADSPNDSQGETILGLLCRVKPPQRTMFADLICQLFDPHLRNPQLQDAVRELESLRAEERAATVTFVLSLIPGRVGRDTPMLVVRSREARRQNVALQLMRYPRNERTAFEHICSPLAPLPSEARIRAVNAVLDTPPHLRANRAYRELSAYILGNVNGPLPQGVGQDAFVHAHMRTENVMETGKIQRVGQAVRLLRRMYPAPPEHHRALRCIECYITGLSEHASEAEKNILARVRGGATEQQNALRVLKDPSRVGDFSKALRDNDKYTLDDGTRIGLGDLAALVWFVIDSCEHADVMRYGFFQALAQCIEDDGHRVCSVGFTQRILRILQGYVPGVAIDDAPEAPRVSPQAFVTFVSERWTQQLGGKIPKPTKLRAFYKQTVKDGEELYGKGTREAALVAEHVSGYLKYTYDAWKSAV